MKKKELLMQVLTKIKPYRSLADGILGLLESGYIDESNSDGILNLLSLSLENITEKKQKEKIKKWIEIIKKIRAEEKSEKTEENIDQLLESI